MIGGVTPGQCRAKCPHRWRSACAARSVDMFPIVPGWAGAGSVYADVMTASRRVEEFEALRPHLMAVAYRLLGTVADAEDVVQDAWLRWQGQDQDINDLRAWLTTVVSRLALDRLRSAAHRRETYVGPWLPEPVVTDVGMGDPLAAVVADEDARFAAMLVLERLTPDQRVAFVLHDGFGVPFGEIADVLGVSAAA